MSINDGSTSTQAYNTVSASASTAFESPLVRNLVTPTINNQTTESTSTLSVDTTVKKSHPNMTFSLVQNRPATSAIQPQVTSNDVQQMLLTFSPDPS